MQHDFRFADAWMTLGLASRLYSIKPPAVGMTYTSSRMQRSVRRFRLAMTSGSLAPLRSKLVSRPALYSDIPRRRNISYTGQWAPRSTQRCRLHQNFRYAGAQIALDGWHNVYSVRPPSVDLTYPSSRMPKSVQRFRLANDFRFADAWMTLGLASRLYSIKPPAVGMTYPPAGCRGRSDDSGWR